MGGRHCTSVLNHAQANNIKGVLTGMQAVLLSRCIHCNVNCARMLLFLLKWCTSGSNTNIAVDVCAIPDNISELVQKVVE